MAAALSTISRSMAVVLLKGNISESLEVLSWDHVPFVRQESRYSSSARLASTNDSEFGGDIGEFSTSNYRHWNSSQTSSATLLHSWSLISRTSLRERKNVATTSLTTSIKRLKSPSANVRHHARVRRVSAVRGSLPFDLVIEGFFPKRNANKISAARTPSRPVPQSLSGPTCSRSQIPSSRRFRCKPGPR